MTNATSTPGCQYVVGCLESLEQCGELISSLTPQQYAGSTGGRSSIGAHLRHCLDHFHCLLGGLENGVVDYDARGRAVEVETELAAGQAVLASLLRDLCELDEMDKGLQLSVVQSCSTDRRSQETKTTLGRELLFLSGHTIHHLALMRYLAEEKGALVRDGLGVAYSTMAYQASKEPEAAERCVR